MRSWGFSAKFIDIWTNELNWRLLASWRDRRMLVALHSSNVRTVVHYFLTLPHSMRQVCVTVRCPSVCLSQLSTAAAACGGFAAVDPAGRRYRWIAARPATSSNGAAAANASSVTFPASVEGWTQTGFKLTLFCRTPTDRAMSFFLTNSVHTGRHVTL